MKISILLQLLILSSYFENYAALADERPQPNRPLAEDPLLQKSLEILRDIISNPLKGKKITFMTEKDSLDGDFIVKTLMGNFLESVKILRFPRRLSNLDLEENMESNDLASNSSLVVDDGFLGRFSAIYGTVIMITSSEDDLWWPFQSNSMKYKELVLLTLRTNCLSKNFFETPLILGTPFFVLICPSNFREEEQSKISFSLWTWKPYARTHHQYVHLGIWNPDSFQSWKQLFIDRYDDMTKKDMLIYANPEGFPYYYGLEDGTLIGVTYQIILTFASVLNFNLTFDSAVTHMWDVMLDKMTRRENDLFINLMFMTEENNEKYDIIRPYLKEGYGLVMKVPPPLPRWKNIIYPFSWLVWVIIAISMICTSFIYHFLHHEYEKSFMNNALSVLQFMLSNAMAYVPKRWRIRNFLIVWWIASWVLQMSYTCNLIAVLTIPVFPKRIQTAKELLDNEFGICMLDYGSFVPNALKTSKNPVLFEMGRILYMAPTNFSLMYEGEEYCEELVLRGTHTHLEGYSYLKMMYRVRGHFHVTYPLMEQIYSSYMVVLARKHNPWSYKLDKGIQRLLEAGIIKKWYEDLMQDTGSIDDARSSELQPLTMDHLQGSFYLMVVGTVIPLLALAQEILSANYFSSPKSKLSGSKGSF